MPLQDTNLTPSISGFGLELGLLHILPQSPLASGGYLPFGSSVVAVGRQQLGDGARSVPRVTSSSQKTGCAKRHLLSAARQHRRGGLAPTVAAPLGQALGPLRLRPVGAFHVGVATHETSHPVTVGFNLFCPGCQPVALRATGVDTQGIGSSSRAKMELLKMSDTCLLSDIFEPDGRRFTPWRRPLPGQFSLSGLGPLILESPVDPPRADGSLFPHSRSRRSSPWRTTPGVRAVSLRPSPVPSRPAGRIQPEGPTRGSGVSSWPGPAMPASPGCRRHRRTSPNTSRPRSGGAPVLQRCGRRGPFCPPGYVRQSAKTGFANRNFGV